MSTATAVPGDLRLAQQVAMHLEEDIIARGWPVGELLGTEASLAAAQGVSRWVMREALAIAEQDGLVEIRRGRLGGIAVSAPVLTVVGSAVRRFLSLSRISAAELYAARALLEGFAARLAIARRDRASSAALAELAARAASSPPDQHPAMLFLVLREVLRSAGNVSLEVLAYALSQATVELALLRGADEPALAAAASVQLPERVTLVEAILAADSARAEAAIARYCASGSAFLAGLAGGSRGAAPLAGLRHLVQDSRHTRARPKLSAQIAWQIEYDLITNDWPAGHFLGSEADLMASYRASRSVIREAIRPLERLGVVEMFRGQGSGLRVGTPNPAAVVRSLVLYLNYFKDGDFVDYELRREIERHLVAALVTADGERRRAVATALGDFASRRYRPTLTSLRQVVHDLGQLLATAADNRILAFFLRILAATVLRDSPCTLPARDAGAAIAAVQQRATDLGDALTRGDGAAAGAAVDHIWATLRDAYQVPRRQG